MMTKESEKSLKVTTRNAEGSSTGSGVRLRTNSSGQQQEQSSEQETPKKSSNNKSKSEKQSGSGGGSSPGGNSQGRQQGGQRSASETNHSSSNSNSNGHQEDNGGGGGNGGQLNGVRTQDQPPPRNRCRCWCCCCSCSWLVNHCCLALRNNEENRSKPKDSDSDLICDADTPPSLEEIRSWGESFDKLMRSAAGRKVLREFLKCEYSEENILFWLACEDLKKESKPELIEEKARLIYEDYISILSPKEVSLDSRVREVVNLNMRDPTPHTFDEAQVQIYTLMHRDSYPRFVNSPLYKKLAQINTQHRGSSVSLKNSLFYCLGVTNACG